MSLRAEGVAIHAPECLELCGLPRCARNDGLLFKPARPLSKEWLRCGGRQYLRLRGLHDLLP